MAKPTGLLPPEYHTAALHYLAGRPPYPPRLIEHVAALTGLARRGAASASAPGGVVPGTRVLDLGCGPGQLAVAFARLGAQVLAVDPEPEMLRIARAAAGEAPIRFMQGSSEDLGPALGRVDLVVMGRSFHWMDRAETLRRLDAMIEPGGAVVLFGDSHPAVPDNAWRAAWREVEERYRMPGSGRPHHGDDWVRHEAVLLDSAFCRLDSVSAIDRCQVSIATMVERAQSTSTHSASRLGHRMDAFLEQIVRALEPFTHDGMITEVVQIYALIASRRDAA